MMCQHCRALTKWQKKSTFINLAMKKNVYLCMDNNKQTMKDTDLRIQALSYLALFFIMLALLAISPVEGGYRWEPWLINISVALLFVLLTGLTATLAMMNKHITGIFSTALFLLLFCPGADTFFSHDEMALMELSSQCIVPFFIMQYTRVSKRDFHRWYFLMLLMGIFCSYTHNGITIPLCATFVWLSFLHRRLFFRRACWPMVVGFVIGTAISVWQKHSDSLTLNTDIRSMTSVTTIIVRTLWDTKVFLLTLAVTAWMTMTQKRRRILLHIGRRHHVIACCFIFSLLTVPLAPLGIDNAVTGVCFFSMFWLLFVSQHIAKRYLHWDIR